MFYCDLYFLSFVANTRLVVHVLLVKTPDDVSQSSEENHWKSCTEEQPCSMLQLLEHQETTSGPSARMTQEVEAGRVVGPILMRLSGGLPRI